MRLGRCPFSLYDWDDVEENKLERLSSKGGVDAFQNGVLLVNWKLVGTGFGLTEVLKGWTQLRLFEFDWKS